VSGRQRRVVAHRLDGTAGEFLKKKGITHRFCHDLLLQVPRKRCRLRHGLHDHQALAGRQPRQGQLYGIGTGYITIIARKNHEKITKTPCMCYACLPGMEYYRLACKNGD
jgi:hypothetical protein